MDVRVCFFGDSFTAGVGDDEALGWVGRIVARARGNGLELTAYNLGVRRQTGPEIAARMAAEASPRLRDGDAHGVVFAFGVNDTTMEGHRPRVSTAASLAALKSVVDLCAARGWGLLVIGPAPIADPAQNERILALSVALDADCASRSVPFVNVAPLLANDRAWLDEVASLDGAHPGRTGYATLAEMLGPGLTDWLTSLTRSK